ncbi:MAG: hypothetical protein IPK87_09100 [Planctomycetes bacterium]|nr:hypothetical protein [Planctomycetota bacterium]
MHVATEKLATNSPNYARLLKSAHERAERRNRLAHLLTSVRKRVEFEHALRAVGA